MIFFLLFFQRSTSQHYSRHVHCLLGTIERSLYGKLKETLIRSVNKTVTDDKVIPEVKWAASR